MRCCQSCGVSLYMPLVVCASAIVCMKLCSSVCATCDCIIVSYIRITHPSAGFTVCLSCLSYDTITNVVHKKDDLFA